jgi:acetyl-CoA acetyltransferase
MRDVAVVSFAASGTPRELEHNEVEIIVPVLREAIAGSGLAKSEIGFVCSGSLDYLFGGPFAFVAGVDAVGAVPPIRESHVEMDSAWALYEAWCYIQTGEIDSALVYGFSKGSIGDVHEILTMQMDPYHVLPLWPSATDMAALQARAYLEANDLDERALAEVSSGAQRDAAATSYAVRSGGVTVDELLAAPKVADPLRGADIFAAADGAAAVVIAAEDVARRVCPRPAWIRGIEHRIEPHGLGIRDLTRSESTRLAAQAAGALDGPADIAELHAQFSHEVLILSDALGLDPAVTRINPSGGPLAGNCLMAAGLERFGEGAQRIWSGEANRAIVHATSGPCLQHNMVAVLEGE